MNLSKTNQIVAIVSGLLAIVGGLNTYFGFPFPELLIFNKHTVTRISTTGDFSIESLKKKNGNTINLGDSFNYKFAVPLSARGTTTLSDTAFAWVVVTDQAGFYYLQRPPVSIRSTQWSATNLFPLSGIKKLIFVQVDSEGNHFFMRKVEKNEWGKFSDMPNDSTEIAFIELD
jgi:hypothetical protein